MAKSRRANAVNFGFDFQVNAAIVLMLENIEDVSALRLEGNYEDIEVKLNDGEYILAQAKSIEKSSTDFHNVRKNLKKALESLSEGAKKCNASELILITNSPNPMNDDSINIFTLDAHRPYSSLPVSSQELVNEYLKQINQPLDTSKFMIQVLPFETDIDAERYKFVRRAVDDFIGNLNVSIPGLSNQILTIWQNDVFHNSTKKDVAIKLSKSEIIWPLMVIATDVDRMDDELEELVDPSVYDDVVCRYKNLIDECCDKCEFFIKVLSDYQLFKTSRKKSERIISFVKTKWKEYKSIFPLQNEDDEIQEALIQVVLFSILKNRISIDHIKRGVNL